MKNVWKTCVMEPPGGRTRVVVLQDAAGGPLAYGEVARLWEEALAFREFFLTTLAEIPFPAYYFETPPVTDRTFGRGFEFAALDGPELARVEPEPQAFANALAAGPADRDVLCFPNLGGDALLVVPRAPTPDSDYAHLAAFLRNAPPHQQHALWQAVGAALRQHVGARPTWLSTAGLGVFWLHVRLDSRPKYYRHAPYKTSG